MKNMPFYDDTYSGTRWVYGLTYRPLGFAQVPDGYIIGSWRNAEGFRYGSVAYPRELSDKEREAFQLELVRSEFHANY